MSLLDRLRRSISRVVGSSSGAGDAASPSPGDPGVDAGLEPGIAHLPTVEASTEPIVLDDEQIAHWHAFGYLALRRFFSADRVEEANEAVEKVWADAGGPGNPLVVDVLAGERAGERLKLSDAPADLRSTPHKLNDLYLVCDVIRDLILDERLAGALADLLGGPAMAINSLNFEFGSQQPLHLDTLYMPPPVDHHLLVTSIALEDVHTDAGPLVYYPGSHLIPPHRFSHGGLHEAPGEMDEFWSYMDGQIAERGLEQVEFEASAGDVIVWHGLLFHGGRKINEDRRTRRSVVTHYWRADDVEPARVATLGPGRHYLTREHQATDKA